MKISSLSTKSKDSFQLYIDLFHLLFIICFPSSCTFISVSPASQPSLHFSPSRLGFDTRRDASAPLFLLSLSFVLRHGIGIWLLLCNEDLYASNLDLFCHILRLFLFLLSVSALQHRPPTPFYPYERRTDSNDKYLKLGRLSF